MLIILLISPLTMRHKNKVLKISANFFKIQAIGCLCPGCNKPSFVVYVLQKCCCCTCIGSLETNQDQISRPPKDQREEKMVKTHPPTYQILHSILKATIIFL
jgi:hypothetical protein